MSVATELIEWAGCEPAPAPRPRSAAAARARLAEVPGVDLDPRLPVLPKQDPARGRAANVAVLRSPTSAGAVLPVRLTRRGVGVLTAVVVAVCGTIWWLAALSADSPAAGAASAPAARSVTVAPGDTLWAIAARVAPQRDPRAEVARLAKRNHLVDAAIMPGQVLVVR